MNGVVYGLLLFMVSSGLTLVFGMMGVLNFAHGSFYMIGAYAGYAIARVTGFWPAMVLAPVVVALIGAAVERWLLEPVHRHGHAQELLLTFGLVFVIEELAKLLFGPFAVDNPMPAELARPALQVGDIAFPAFKAFIGVVAAAMFAGLFALLRLTRAGLVVRAAVHRPDMVSALGHDVSRVFMLVFALGAGLAGLAGAVAGVFYPVSPNMAHELGVIVFVVVVVGGLGSLPGALVASLLIGLSTTFAVGIDATLGDGLRTLGLAWTMGGIFDVRLSSMSGAIPFFLMLLILLLRPSGLLGERA
nr:branched-chain amino acid ABC transporter permease [Siccirubricoccus soli]